MFDESELIAYHEKIRGRFINPHLSDEISRVARTPIRKLGYNERFIRPIRELSDRNLSYKTHLSTAAKIFKYKDSADEQAVALQKRVASEPLRTVIASITELKDDKLITALQESIEAL